MSNTGRETPNKQPKGWRLLAYMAGDNNLSADMAWALQSMKGYLDNYPANTGQNQLEVIAQYDPNGLKPRVLEISGQVGLKGPATGGKPGEKDGTLDTAVTHEITLKETFDDVSNDLKTFIPSVDAAPAPVTQDLTAYRFADLSTEAMLRSFIGDHLDGDSRHHMLV